MRVLVVGAGGVGSSAALIAARRDFFESWIVADYDLARARGAGRPPRRPALRRRPDRRLRRGTRSPTSCRAARHHPRAQRGRPALRHAASSTAPSLAGADYLDTAMSLSRRIPSSPTTLPGVMLGDEQFAEHDAVGRQRAGSRSSGMGVEPGLADVFARYAADHLFSEIDELGVRDASNLVVARLRLRPVVLDLDHDRGVPQPAGDLGEGARAGSPPSRSASPRCSTSPRASARSSASTSSTRRSC